MKKIVVLAMSLAIGLNTFAQDATTPTKFKSSESTVSFESKTPMEDIFAETKKAKAGIHIPTKRIVVKIKMISFKFEKPLMEEHFNEKYIESEKFPNGSFDGKIQEDVDLNTDGTYKVTVKGTLTIHGVKQERTLEGVIVVANGKIDLKTNFAVNLVDHEVKIPSAVVTNIAETIQIKAHFICIPHVKK